MNAKKCDRCGTLYEEVEPNAIQVLVESFIGVTMTPQERILKSISSELDLCPGCCNSLSKWMKEGRKCTKEQKPLE